MWAQSEEIYNELKVNQQKAIEFFANQEKFSKLNKDQVSLLIYIHGVSVLQAVYSLEALLSKVNIKDIVGAAEENREISLFILNTQSLYSICDGDDLVRLVEVAKEILEREDLVTKLSIDQKRQLNDASHVMNMMQSTRKMR